MRENKLLKITKKIFNNLFSLILLLYNEDIFYFIKNYYKKL